MTSDIGTGAFPQTLAAVVVAAGRGERAGTGNGPKQYRQIGGRAVIRQTLEALVAHSAIGRIVVAIHPDDTSLFTEAAGDLAGRVEIVAGGSSRQASTLNALLRLQGDDQPDAVLIHDGVRPFIDGELLNRVISAIAMTSGALPALPVSDTIKRVDSGLVGLTVERQGLYAAQTPQGFPFQAILQAHRRAADADNHRFTDDASIAEWAGLPVRVVEGAADNVKLTWARDIEMADARLTAEGSSYPDVRTGNGYDVHAFGDGDKVTLCGVELPYSRSLSGHSDADVALHALTDALLATCGAGDIGDHFPPSDPQWRGAPSRIFLKHAADVVRSRRGRIANADVTLICEAPRIGPRRQEMREALAAMLAIDVDRVSVKATTNEKLGFIGREEGIAAIATATIVFPGRLPT